MVKKNKKIVVGMSGGVDSSLALVLLKEQGWDPVGVSLRYAVWEDKENLLRENICCSAESFKIARNVCRKLKASHHIVDVANEFRKEVIDYFLDELKNNRTPNPCVICNPRLKFKHLFDWAVKHGIEHIATGHYAGIKKNARTGKYELRRAKDKKKDQSYCLSFLPQKWLGRIVFPLEDYTKSEIYKMAEQKGFDIFFKQKQSQDFCFVSGKSLPCFLAKEIGRKNGLIKDAGGNILGRHQGLHFYTIGQRKGINLSNGPYFVAGFDIKKNILIVTKDEKDLYGREAVLSSCYFISDKTPEHRIKIKAKIRSRHTAADAVLIPAADNKMKLVFNKLQKSITPGQFAVFYHDDVCLGGGKIIEN